MGLSRKFLETEIEKAEAAIGVLKNGLALNELILKAFEIELKKLPQEKIVTKDTKITPND